MEYKHIFVICTVVITITPFIARDGGTLPPIINEFFIGVAGDFGFGTQAKSLWARLPPYHLEFFLALGDLSYGQTTERTWCETFKASIPNLLIVAGNHDSGESSGGNINEFVKYCPYSLSSTPLTGIYGKEYYFDYPYYGIIGWPYVPMARFIMISPGIRYGVDGQATWTYSVGDAHYKFVSDAIDNARALGIKWIIVGMHKVCITAGSKSCEVGQAMLDLFQNKRVDLVLQGHEHNYQRSKHLLCAKDNVYLSGCVTNSGDVYGQGNGTLIAIVGTGGANRYSVNLGSTEGQYFMEADSTSHGFLGLAFTQTMLVAYFEPSYGMYRDAFIIRRNA